MSNIVPPATLAPEPALRVLHLNSLLNGGGTDDQCVRLAHQLVRLGQKIWIAGPEGHDFTKIVRAIRIPFEPAPEGAAKVRLIFSAAKLIRGERVQIVHGHHGRDLWPTIVAARLSGLRPKVVLSRHLAKSPSSWFSRHSLLQNCDAMVAVSQFVARVLREGAYEPDSSEPERRSRPPLGGDHSKIHVIHGGIDTSRFRPAEAAAQREAWKLRQENYAFAVVGGYDLPRGKGQREFLKAAAQVHERIPGARFLIIGRGNMKQTLEADINALGLTGKAWLTPWCQDMAAAMNAVDCLVHPQVGTEAFQAVVLEAFACGRSVIASRLDGIPEAFAAGCFGQLVTPESIAELSEALVIRMRAPVSTWSQRLQLHRRIDQEFSLAVCARKTLELYRRLLSRVSSEGN